jgi:hypothetical protein
MVRVVVAVAVLLAVASPARAGTYQVTACAGGANRSWAASNSNDAAFDVKPGCPFEVYSAVTGGAQAGFFEAAWWRLNAPPGTVIDRLRLARYGYRFVDKADRPEGGQVQGGWTTGAYVVDAGVVKPIAGESCLVQPGAYLCDFGSKNTSAPVDLDLNATQVTYQIACIREGGTCPTESGGFPLAGMTIFNAVATVRDDSPPTISLGGGLLAGGWQRPDEEISVDASDVTGISAVTAAAGTATGALATPCDYTRMIPCSGVKAGKLRLTGLADGRQPLTVTVKDAAGNPASASAAINVDGTAPYVEWRPRSGRTLQAKVSDASSGVAGGQISVDGAALPTTLAGGRLRGTLPAKLAAGAQVTVSATDNAGNTAAGVPAWIDIRQRVRARNGRSVTLRGRLLTPGGSPIPNVPIQSTATISRRGATAEPGPTAMTNARGRFALKLPAGPSRAVRLTVAGGGGLLPLVRSVAVRVPASSTIHASRRAVGAGTRVVFSGRIRAGGQRLPSRGLIVVLQGRSAGAWRTFADTRTTPSGRWRASYRFRGVPGRYPVRLRIRRATGFPFELGYSPTVSVRVR